MSRMTLIALVLLTAVGLCAAPASADNAATCGDQNAAPDSRIAACTQAIGSGKGRGPNLSWAFFNRGVGYLEKRDNDRAIADYTEAIRLGPRDADAFVGRGSAYSNKHDYDRAMTDYNEAIRLDPKSASAFTGRGNVYGDKGDYDRAIADLTEAIRLDPMYALAYTNRGLAYEKKGDIARARADFDFAWDLPQKYMDDKAARDTARAHLAALPVPPAAAAPPAAPPVAIAPAIAATPGRRVALVIGNSAYTGLHALPNPRNDATDMTATLTALGFEVTRGVDLKRSDMEETLIRFAREARRSDTALVFYSGHGIQHLGDYLIPVDARIEDEADLRKLVRLKDVIGDLQNASKVRILIIDACRDNEGVQQLAANLPATKGGTVDRGFARVSGAFGTLVAFATQPDRVAADGDGRNSPFTKALLKHLPTPGVELRTLMTRVRADVNTATGGAQLPELSDSMIGEFVFKAGQ
jgi:Tfp pilus assembly protein PilF